MVAFLPPSSGRTSTQHILSLGRLADILGRKGAMLLALSLFGESRAQFRGVHKVRPQHSVSFTIFGPGCFRFWYHPLRNGFVNEVYDSC